MKANLSEEEWRQLEALLEEQVGPGVEGWGWVGSVAVAIPQQQFNPSPSICPTTHTHVVCPPSDHLRPWAAPRPHYTVACSLCLTLLFFVSYSPATYFNLPRLCLTEGVKGNYEMAGCLLRFRVQPLTLTLQSQGQDDPSTLSANPYALTLKTTLEVQSLALLLFTNPAATSPAAAAVAAAARASASRPAGALDATAKPVIVMDASMDRLWVQVRTYPKTVAAAVRVGAAGVGSPHGRLLSTGLIAPHSHPHIGMGTKPGSEGGGIPPSRSLSSPALTLNTGEAGAGAGGADSHPCALALDITKAPQDGSADIVARLLIAPSFATYVPAALNAVHAFFATPGPTTTEFVALQARATAQAEALRKLAALQLQALGAERERPKLLLDAVAYAPKVAVPDERTGHTLVLDLGCFTLRTSRWGPANLVTTSHAQPGLFLPVCDTSLICSSPISDLCSLLPAP